MKNKWLLFIVLYFAALCVSLSQLKVVTILGDMAQLMNLTMSQVSMLMSVFTLAGIILAIPGGAFLNKLGPKKLLLTLMSFLFAGNLIGAFSTTSYAVLLVSRVLEGVSFAMIIMTGIVMLSQWFAGSNVGLAIGMFTTFPATGSAIAMNVAAPIAHKMGINSLWLIMAALTALAFILVAIVIRVPKAAAGEAAAQPMEQPSLGEALSNGRTWILAVCHGCVAFILFTFITIYPQIFSGLYGLEAGTANFYASLNGLFGIPFCILSGYIIDKFKNAPLLISISFIGLAIACFITTKLGPSTFILHTFLTAAFTGLIIAANLAIAPGVAKRPVLIGYTVALVNMVYYIGIFAGAPLVLGAVERSGWQSGVNILTVASGVGLVFILIFMSISRQKA